MFDKGDSLILVMVMSLVVISVRAIPFLIFRGKETPASILYLGRYLPYAIMGMLLVYCLRNTPVLDSPYGIPEAIGVGVTVLLQLWKKQSLLSIIVGTLLYMVLVQVVFV